MSSEIHVPARVLVIDDEEILLKAYRRMLSEHDVVLACGGTNAVELLRDDTNFDVVFCDLMMPELDGRDVYEAVRERAPDLAARIVFSSGGAFSERLSDFVAALPNVVLDKPFTANALRAALEAARARR